MSQESLGYVCADDVRAARVEGSTTLRIEVRDQLCVLSASIKRAFPGSNPNEYFSVVDGSGKEVFLLHRLEGLDSASRELFAQSLDRRYFTPKILRIASLKQDGGMWLFEVETQRGPAHFYVRNWRESAHEIAHDKLLILSIDGQRYVIPKVSEIDARSQAYLDEVY